MSEKNIMIPERLFVDLCLYLLDDNPDPDTRWELVDRMQEKIDRMCRRQEYSASLSTIRSQGRHAPVDRGKQGDS